MSEIDTSTEAVEALISEIPGPKPVQHVHKLVSRNADTLRALAAERDRLREALTGLERAATETLRYGAQTGGQWTRLTSANLKARAALKEQGQ